MTNARRAPWVAAVRSNSASNCAPSPVDRWAGWTQVMPMPAASCQVQALTARPRYRCNNGEFDCIRSWDGGGVEVVELVGEALVESGIGRADLEAMDHFEILTR